MCINSCCTNHTCHAIMIFSILALLLWPNAPNMNILHSKNNTTKPHTPTKGGAGSVNAMSPPCTTTSPNNPSKTTLTMAFIYGALFTLVLIYATNNFLSSPKHTQDHNSNSNNNNSPRSMMIVGPTSSPRSTFMGSNTRHVQDEGGGIVEGGGIGHALLRTFPTFSYSARRRPWMGKGASVCAICQSKFKEDQMVRWLPECDHLFHLDCIDEWLTSHATCPCCRADLELTIDHGSTSYYVTNYDNSYEYNLYEYHHI